MPKAAICPSRSSIGFAGQSDWTSASGVASGIAVSIVSEILAELNGRIPKPQFRPSGGELAAEVPQAAIFGDL